MEISIRKMNARDEAQVLAMMRVFYRSPAVRTEGSEEIYLRDFRLCVGDSPYLEGYMLEREGAVCGYAMVAKSFSTEFGKPCIYVEDLYLLESARGRGIGSAFFAFLGRQYPDAVFRLEVEQENIPAIRLYRKMGYTPSPYLEMKMLSCPQPGDGSI
ncbi:MAG: GNAT family N-acetyltransferase [Firmicutes bacterium]|nr:GNAT family N-acetyltransferase [Bacillota bacterium]